MLYSQKPFSHSSDLSCLFSNRVFAGQYWDEFGITGHLLKHKKAPRVLMLGLAYGGGIRPIHASAPNVQLTTVDCEPSLNVATSEVFREHFPQLKFKIYDHQAEKFISSIKTKYDAIWVDIYIKDQYSPYLFDITFWENIKNILSSKGKVFINLFGIPSHLQPLKNCSAQRFIPHLLKNVFTKINYLPHRRNITLILEDEETSPHFQELSPNDNLQFRDQLYDKINYIRSCNLPTCNTSSFEKETISQEKMAFSYIDKQMFEQWDHFIPKINKSISSSSYQINNTKDILEFLNKKELVEQSLQYFLDNFIEDITFFPNIFAGEVSCSNTDPGHFIDWYFLNHKTIREKSSYIHDFYFLPQIASIIINPFGKNQRYLFQMMAIVDEVILSLKKEIVL